MKFSDLQSASTVILAGANDRRGWSCACPQGNHKTSPYWLKHLANQVKFSDSSDFCPGVYEPEAPASKHRKKELPYY